jgi:hypothetical protein
MAAIDSWDSIKKHGLLSTSRLLDLFEIPANERKQIEGERRPHSVPIEHKKYGRVVIRDQKPLSEAKLKKCLHGYGVERWFRLLNANVFFWLDLERLKTMMSAREYRGKVQTILTVDAEPLIRKYESKIRLSPLNTGSTSPFAHPRGADTFKTLAEYPFVERMNRGDYGCVAELTVEGGVPDIARYTQRAAHGRIVGKQLRITEILYQANPAV